MNSDPTFALALLQPARVELESLAAAWLTVGARRVGLIVDEIPLLEWPMGFGGWDFEVEIKIDSPFTIKLAIAGIEGGWVKNRLMMDARFLARIVKQETELDRMATDFIENQDQMLALYDLVQASRFHLEIDVILQETVELLKQMVNVEGVFAIFISGNKRIVVQTMKKRWKWKKKALLEFKQFIEVGEPSEFLQAKQVGRSDLPPKVRQLFLQNLLVREKSELLIGLFNKVEGTLITAPDLKLARTVIAQAAVQVETALLLEETLDQARLQAQMELARTVQMGFLPEQMPDIETISCAMRSRPAWEVGGDFYDYIVQKEGGYFVLGDVSGKGMAAALIMSMSRVAIRAALKQELKGDCHALLADVNNQLYDDFTEAQKFVTLFLAYYEPEKRVLHYANAGHSPVIYCPVGGKPQMLEADGPPLGVLPMMLSETQQLSLQPGDLLIVATDGFVEAVNKEQEMWGYERFFMLIDQLRALPVEEIVNQLFEAVDQFAGDELQADDLTISILKGGL